MVLGEWKGYGMTPDELKKVFSKNLRFQLLIHEKQPVDIVNDLKIPFSTVSNWINGLKFPRMGKVEMLANYFGIEKSDLIEEKKGEQSASDNITYPIPEDIKGMITMYLSMDEQDKNEIMMLMNTKMQKYDKGGKNVKS